MRFVTVSQSTNRAALISQTCGCGDGQELSNLRRAEKVRLRLISIVSADSSTSAPLPLAQSIATSMVAEQKQRFQAVQRVTLFCKLCFCRLFPMPKHRSRSSLPRFDHNQTDAGTLDCPPQPTHSLCLECQAQANRS